MAVVGEAHILVRAVTTHLRKDIREGFSGMGGHAEEEGKKTGRSYGKGLSKEMQAAGKNFSSMMRKGYFAQAGIGALLGSVSALAGGIGALAGATASAAGSMSLLANGMVQLKIASAVGKSAFNGISQAVAASDKAGGGAAKTMKELREELQQLAFAAEEAALGEEEAALKLEKARETLARVQNLPPDNRARREAELAYKQAELGYRRAKDKASDAMDELQNPKKSAGSGGGQDPFADLTKTQKEFAKFLVENKYRMKELREAAASGFLPELQKQMEYIFKSGLFDGFVSGFAMVSKGLGQATEAFSRSFLKQTTLQEVADIFKSIQGNVGMFGSTLGNTFRGFATYLKITDPLLKRFSAFLNMKSDMFSLNMVKNGASINRFFQNAMTNASKFGEIFSNLWTRFKQFIDNTTGPGSGGEKLLNFFVEASGKFKTMDADIRAFGSRNYFAQTAETTIVILKSLGGILKAFAKLGTDPAVAAFWQIISDGNGSIQKLAESAVKTSPSLARILVALVDILATLADANQTIVFLDTINFALEQFAGFLQVILPLLTKLGPILGFIGALGALGVAVKFLTFAMGGLVINAIKPLLLFLSFIFPGSAAASTGLTALGITTSNTARAMSVALFSIPFVGWAAAAVTAIATVTAALSMWSASTAEANMEETKAMARNGASWKELQKDAAKTSWAFTDLSKDTVALRNTFDSLSLHQESGLGWLDFAYGGRAQDLAGIMERYGAAINENLSVNGLSAAREGLKSLRKENKLSTKELRTGYKEMDVLRQSVREYADSLGVTVTNLDGTYNAQKELNFIMNPAIEQMAIAKIKQDEMNRTIRETTMSFFDFSGPLQQNAEDVKKWAIETAKATKSTGDSWKDYYKDFDQTKFSADYYFAQLDKQLESANKYTTNLTVARTKLSATAFDALYKMGKEGAGLVDAVAVADDDTLQELEFKLRKLGKITSGTLAGQVAASFDKQYILQAIRKQFPTISESMLKSLAAGMTETQLMDRFGIKFSQLASAAVGQESIELQAKWAPNVASDLRSAIAKDFNNVPLQMAIGSDKDGGYITQGNKMYNSSGIDTSGGWKNGGFIKKFAVGGVVPGAQGPRSDNVFSMLSAGEYVINAASTYRYRPLLEAINNGSIDRMQNTGNIQAASASNNFSIVVNAAPGMDASQVAQVVASQIDKQLNMGGRL